jgi:cell division transport system permease protein
MQLTYVFSELGNGLKRNVSMTVAVIVTIFVSLTLVGMGLLLNAQANKAEQYWGSKLQITVFLCNQNSTTANCVNGEATGPQKQSIEKVLDTNPEVDSWRLQTKQEAYDKWKAAYVSNDDTERRVYESIKPSDMQESYWVQLKDPEKFMGIKSAVHEHGP